MEDFNTDFNTKIDTGLDGKEEDNQEEELSFNERVEIINPMFSKFGELELTSLDIVPDEYMEKSIRDFEYKNKDEAKLNLQKLLKEIITMKYIMEKNKWLFKKADFNNEYIFSEGKFLEDYLYELINCMDNYKEFFGETGKEGDQDEIIKEYRRREFNLFNKNKH